MIVVVMGVSGSGKTTVGRLLAQQLGWKYLEGDDFHSPENIEKMSNGVSLTNEDRMPWLARMKNEIDNCFENGSDAVVACSALQNHYRAYLAAGISTIRFVYLKGESAVIRERMKSRGNHYMKSEMLDSQFASLEEPPDAIVADIRKAPEDIVSQVESELMCIANRGAS